MSPPLLVGVEEEGEQCSGSVVDGSCGLKERNYLGLPDSSSSSSVDSNSAVVVSDENENRGNRSNLNLKATELRLGLPGSQSPERESELISLKKLDEKPLFPLLPSASSSSSKEKHAVVSGNKRGFADTMDGFSEVKGGCSLYKEKGWMFHPCESDSPQSVGQGKYPSRPSGVQSSAMMNDVPQKGLQDGSRVAGGTNLNQASMSNNNGSVPAAKAQVVGWPPIRSFRKNTLATTSKNNDEVDGKPGPGALFIKVSMDGAPYLRKVDLRTYSTYQELSSALEKMFSCFTIGQCGSHGAPGREKLSESKLRDLLHGSEYVLTYEDKDGDWMLVGDVPWEMFIDTCKRLKIMKSSDAIGLAPRAMEKTKIGA